MLFRTAVESDLDRIVPFASHDPLHWPDTDQLRRGIADGSWRLSHQWLALDGDRLVGLARWWTPPGGERPVTLDALYVDESVPDRTGLAIDLLAHGHQRIGKPLEYHMFLPARWRDGAATSEAVAWRREALSRLGMTDVLERLRYRWTPETGVPEPDPRLVLRPADDETFVDAFRRVSEGSLDAGTRKGIAEHGVDGEARDHMGVYLTMRGDRDWWRLAYTPDGELAGLSIPSANGGGYVVGYLGVVPGQRGKGYVGILLNHITGVLAAEGAQAITADTDTTNAPMAAAFERAGYAHFATRLVIDRPA